MLKDEPEDVLLGVIKQRGVMRVIRENLLEYFRDIKDGRVVVQPQ